MVSTHVAGTISCTPAVPKRPAGVVLPTSLLDALLGSVPAASVPPLLTATLLTPFLTADYATSLLRERCALDAAPDHEHTDALRGSCASTATSLSKQLGLHGHLFLARDLDMVLSQSKLLESRVLGQQPPRMSDVPVIDLTDRRALERRKAMIVDTALRCLTMGKSQWVEYFPVTASFTNCVVRLPAYECIDGSSRHGQLELRTFHQADVTRNVVTTVTSRIEIGCRCWRMKTPSTAARKRQRGSDSLETAKAPWYRSSCPGSEVFDSVTVFPETYGLEFDQAVIITLLEPFIALTPLGGCFDVTLLVATAVALSQVPPAPHQRYGQTFRPLDVPDMDWVVDVFDYQLLESMRDAGGEFLSESEEDTVTVT